MPVRIAINGVGRIGRNVLRSALIGCRTDLDLVAINDLTYAATLAHLFEFDSVHGRFPDSVAVDGSAIVVGEERFEVLSERDPANLPWVDLDIDIVIESTGIFRKRQDAAKHLEAGARKVMITAPAPDPDLSVV
ncbi:MAG: glyceraldehyde 3-phosphate dehydrogenase NAD-binding domain-containing protein, partial [Gemmatimonadota bacterium]